MRLSDAIRLGALLHPQHFGALFMIARASGDVIATCALGAAQQAGFCLDRATGGGLYGTGVQCPEPRCGAWCHVVGIVTHLNDSHRWTREQIADWVEHIETQEGLQRKPDGITDVHHAACSPGGELLTRS